MDNGPLLILFRPCINVKFEIVVKLILLVTSDLVRNSYKNITAPGSEMEKYDFQIA